MDGGSYCLQGLALPAPVVLAVDHIPSRAVIAYRVELKRALRVLNYEGTNFVPRVVVSVLRSRVPAGCYLHFPFVVISEQSGSLIGRPCGDEGTTRTIWPPTSSGFAVAGGYDAAALPLTLSFLD
jgi:hypothetical protein